MDGGPLSPRGTSWISSLGRGPRGFGPDGPGRDTDFGPRRLGFGALAATTITIAGHGTRRVVAATGMVMGLGGGGSLTHRVSVGFAATATIGGQALDPVATAITATASDGTSNCAVSDATAIKALASGRAGSARPDRGDEREFGRGFGREFGGAYRRGRLPWWHPDVGPRRGGPGGGFRTLYQSGPGERSARASDV